MLSPTRIIGSLLPGRVYHWLVVRLACLPISPAATLPHSVVFRHPLRLRTEHYLLIPTDYWPTILDLPRPAARRLQQEIAQWLEATGWTHARIVVNFGAYQDTPFLHLHLLPSSGSPTPSAAAETDWLTVELDGGSGALVSGRRVVSYDVIQRVAEITTEVNRH